METREATSLHYVKSKLGEYAVHRAALNRQDAAAELCEEWQNESHGQADTRPRAYTAIPQASLRTFQATSTGASSCDVFGLVPPHMPSMQGAGKTSNAPTIRGLKASNTHKRRSKLEQGIRRIDAMLGAAVPGLAPGSNSKAPTKQNPPTACVPHPVIITVAPRIPRDGPQQRTDPPVEPDSEDEDVIMIDQDIDGLSEQFHDAISPKRGTANAQRQVSSPQHKQWVTPEAVGLYCQAQVGGNCALHALNAMAGRPIITPDEAQALLRHPQVPSPADSERPDCNTDGWFRWEAIHNLLYYTTTIDLTLLVLKNPQSHPQHSGSTTSAKARVLALAPQGCNALFLHKPGHFICWKRSPINGKWYSLDSIPYATTHRIQELTDADWAAFNGTISTTIAADAYLHNATGLTLYKHRYTPSPANRSHMQYVDLAGIELHTAGPTHRPAAAWIEEDTERARARAQRIAQARAGRAKQLPKSKPAQCGIPPQIAQAALKHSQNHNKPTKAQKQTEASRPHRQWRPATPLNIRVCRQFASHCGLHALEAMVGQPIATPREVTKYLQETWPAREDKEGQQGDHYSTQGNYSDLALQRILYWFWCRRACQGTESLEMHVVSGHEQLQKGNSSEAIIRQLHQAEAFMVNYTTHPSAGQDSGRHWHVVRKGRTDNGPTPDWYLVDSLDQGAQPGLVKVMTEADWTNIHGTLYIIKQSTEKQMLDSCEFTDEELLAHQQRLEGEEARAAHTHIREQSNPPRLHIEQAQAQRSGLTQTPTIRNLNTKPPTEPGQRNKRRKTKAPKTVSTNAKPSSIPVIENYFHKQAQPTAHAQEILHPPLHSITNYQIYYTHSRHRGSAQEPKWKLSIKRELQSPS